MKTVETVLDHAGFFQAGTLHYGHTKTECGQHGPGGLPCKRFQVGVALRIGIVSWFEADTWREAFELAHAAIVAPPHDFQPNAPLTTCLLCGVERYAHTWPLKA